MDASAWTDRRNRREERKTSSRTFSSIDYELETQPEKLFQHSLLQRRRIIMQTTESETAGDALHEDEAQSQDGVPRSASIRCIAGDCGLPVEKLSFCISCRATFACCSNECYSKPETHRFSTQHYLTCHRIEWTPLQKKHNQLLIQQEVNWDHYKIQYTSPCRRCGFTHDYTTNACHHCSAVYCSRTCKEEDAERHASTQGECVRRITKQLPPNTLASSVHSSILVPDLLAHTISFLSVYQWSFAGRVNHAWRNVTLQPSAFPHEMVDLLSQVKVNSPSIGAVHRACIRSFACHWREDTPYSILSDYSHLRLFECGFDNVYSETDKNSYSDQIAHLSASTLRSLKLLTTITISNTAAFTRFTHLRNLSLELRSGTRVLHTFAPILQQLAQLAQLKLVIDGDNESQNVIRSENCDLDCNAIASILDTIAIHLHALTDLDLFSHFHSVYRLLTKRMPQILRFTLSDSPFDLTTSHHDIHALARMNLLLPRVIHLNLTFYFRTLLLANKEQIEKVQLLREAIITCIDGFAPTLLSLNFSFSNMSLASDRIDGDDDNDYSHHALTEDEIGRLLARCAQLQALTLANFDALKRTPDEIKLLSKLTPMLHSLDINLRHLSENEISSSSLADMFESLHLWFPHLTEITIISPEASLPFAAPSTEFRARQDSLPRLKKLSLRQFDVETHLPSLLRLLPPIDLLNQHGTFMSAERFFEYAQYCPLVFPSQSLRHENAQQFPQMKTIDEDDLHWFDVESELVRVDSILTPSSLPVHLHSHYHAGVALSLKRSKVPSSIRENDNHDVEKRISKQQDSIRGRSGGRGRDTPNRRSAGCTRKERQVRKSAWLDSHGWMFERVKNWKWNWCEVITLTPRSILEKREESMAGRGGGRGRGRGRGGRGGVRDGSSTGSFTDEDDQDPLLSRLLIPDLPEAFAYHRSSVWIYTHAVDVARNPDFNSLARRFGHFVDERSLKIY